MVVMSKMILVAIACSLCLSSCGHKGKLKTPSQIEREEQKKKEQ